MPVIVALVAAGLLWFLATTLGGAVSINKPQAPTMAIGLLADAIAKAEGSNPAWNNPGDLTKSFGYVTTGVANSDGVLIFLRLEDGWQALYKQLEAIISGNSHYTLSTTLADFGFGYSGGDRNWAVNVADALGVDPSVTLGSILEA
jgi:hypothetical protein